MNLPRSTVASPSPSADLKLDAFPRALLDRLARERLVAVATVERAEDAVPLARALVAGGVRVLELAWRARGTLDALRAMLAEVPELLIGIGTLLTPDQVDAAAAAGAHFGVSPGCSEKVVTAARAAGLAYAPGIQTPTDVHAAIELGCGFLKFFPAETAGGVAHLRSLHAPFAHLGLRYLPLGGIDERGVAAYLTEPAVAAVGGSWIAPATLVRAQAWSEIAQRAAAARRAVPVDQRNFA